MDHYKFMQSLLAAMKNFCAGLMNLAMTAEDLAEVVISLAPRLLQKSVLPCDVIHFDWIATDSNIDRNSWQ